MDLEKLVDQVTKAIMKQLQESGGKKKVLLLGEDREMAAALGGQYQVDCCSSLANAWDYDFVVLPTACLGKSESAAATVAAVPACPTGDELDFTGKKLIHERELRERCVNGVTCIKIDSKAIVTSLAADFIKSRKLSVARIG